MSFDYELTEDEAGVAAARMAWRLSLSDGLLARHLAPLAAFALAILFVAILGWTGLVSRRAAEIGLIGAAAIYMIYRLWTRRRFLTARRAADAWARGWRAAGPARLDWDEAGFALRAGPLERDWRFVEGLEVEEVAGLAYVWPPRGEPLVFPLRAEGAEAALAAARARARAGPLPAPDDDDD
jgi:hypothetical protein